MELKEEQFQSWIGNTETVKDQIRTSPLTAMAAMLDRSPLTDLEALPPLWHWLFFLKPANQSELGADGHPEKGDFLPPIDLPRRMWAGSRFQFHHPLFAGDQIERKSEILNVTIKEGRSGQLAFVCVGHTLSNQKGPALYEEHDIVYRSGVSNAASSPPTPAPAPKDEDFSRTVNPDPILLFRYSALTFNGHRIHYDREYATQVEGYDGLIVHGPLLATLLTDVLLENVPECELMKFEFKALSPVFDLNSFEVCGKKVSDNGEYTLWIRDNEGSLCMQAKATINIGHKN